MTFWRASNVTFTDDTFLNAPGIGVLLSNVDHTGFTGCAFNNIGNTANPAAKASSDPFFQGIAFCSSDTNDSVANYVANCTFSAIGLDAVSATDQTGFSATGNSMSGLDSLPASYWESKTEGSAGIYLSKDHDTTIARNFVQDASGNALDITDSDNLSVVGNTFSRAGGSGIAFAKVNVISIVGNTISDNNQVTNHFFGQAGITVADRLWGDGGTNSSNIIVADNLITDNQAARTQNWAIQVSMQANPQNFQVYADNYLSGNVSPDGIGSSGIAQAWIDGADGSVEDLANTAGATPWTPVFVDSAALSIALADCTGASGTEPDTSVCTIAGSGDPFLPVVLTSGTTILATATADSSGNWSFTPSGLADGPTTIVATQTDISGHTESATLSFLLDTRPPAVTMALQDGDTAVIPHVRLVGTGDGGALVTLTEGTTTLGSATSDTAGDWSFLPTGLAAGTHRIVATEIDAAGNVGTAALTFTLAAHAGMASDTALPGGGNSDILFRDAASGALGEYLMNDGQPAWDEIGWADPGLLVAGVGDFNGNDVSDVLFRDPAGGGLGQFAMNDNQATWSAIGWADPRLQVVGVGDFNGDDTDDILFRDPASGNLGDFLMNDGQPSWTVIGWADPRLQVVGVGDFNGDGTSDILFRDPTGGALGMFAMTDNQPTWTAIGWADPHLQAVGIGDFTGDGADDILFRDPDSGSLGAFLMSNGQPTWAGFGQVSPGLQVAGVGDYTGCGAADILFRDPADGALGTLAVNNNQTTWAAIASPGPGWNVTG